MLGLEVGEAIWAHSASKLKDSIDLSQPGEQIQLVNMCQV